MPHLSPLPWTLIYMVMALWFFYFNITNMICNSPTL